MHRTIPTPTLSQFAIGPFTFHFYALCIIAGISIAIWLGDKRLRLYGENSGVDLKGVVSEVSVIAVPSGVIGGRLYHVLTSPDAYFGPDGDVIAIFKIWKGGLGIWGAIAMGVLGAYLSYRNLSKKMDLPNFKIFLDALAPGILLAQAIGRFGNWFNGELFGRPLNSWWALEIPYKYRPKGYGLIETFHPTFLYEAICTTLLATILLKFGNRWAAGSIFYIYIAGYSFARFFIEGLRIDQAHNLLGMRINQWVSLGVIALGLTLFIRNQRIQREQITPEI
jgi:prolipoprotein diacylglyceryl transferase